MFGHLTLLVALSTTILIVGITATDDDYSVGKIDYVDSHALIIEEIQAELRNLKLDQAEKAAKFIAENVRLRHTVDAVLNDNLVLKSRLDIFNQSLSACQRSLAGQNSSIKSIKRDLDQVKNRLDSVIESGRLERQADENRSILDRKVLSQLRVELDTLKSRSAFAERRFNSKLQRDQSSQIHNDTTKIKLLRGESTLNSRYSVFGKMKINQSRNEDRNSIVQQMSTNVIKINNLLDKIDRNVSLLNDKYTWYSFIVEHFNAELSVVKEELYKMMHLFYGIDDENVGRTFNEPEHYEIGAPVAVIEESSKKKKNLRTELDDVRLAANDAKSVVHQLTEKFDGVFRRQSVLNERCDEALSNGGGRQKFAADLERIQLNVANLTDLVDETSSRLATLLRTVETQVADLKQRLDHEAMKVNKSALMADAIRRHQSSHFSSIQNLRQKNLETEGQLNVLSFKFAQLQAEVLNKTLDQVKGESNSDLKQDVRLAAFDSQLERLNLKIIGVQDSVKEVLLSLRRKADYVDVKKLATDLENVVTKMQALSNLSANFTTIAGSIATLESQLPTDCSFTNIPFRYAMYNSGSYLIKPENFSLAFKVMCTVEEDEKAKGQYASSSWTVIQRRHSLNVQFNRTWNEYRAGFGDSSGDYWLGNENIHFLTSQAPYQLKIDVWDIYGEYHYAVYDDFAVKSESAMFELNIGSMASGNLSDSLTAHNGAKFSATDRDNDASSMHCAKFYESGWWFTHCHSANLNGRAGIGIIWFNNNTRDWMQLKRSTMRIGRKNLP